MFCNSGYILILSAHNVRSPQLKNSGSKTPLKPKTPFKWLLMDIIPSIPLIVLTGDNNFSNYLLIVDSYSRIPKIYERENKNTEDVMYKLDIFRQYLEK